jgi:hypothetical protein
MIRLVGFVSATSVAFCSTVMAALPPQYQRLAELRAILDDSRVVGAFTGRPIDKIERIAEDLYRLTAGTCSMDVAIKDNPSGATVIGPRRFLIDPGQMACK